MQQTDIERTKVMDEKKRELLTRFANELNDAEDVENSSLFTADELGTDVDVVRCLIKETGSDLIDTLGEFFFLPIGNEEVSYFTTMITIIDEMEPDEAAAFAEAVARINFFVPVGSFAIDEEESGLVFKYAVPIMDDASDDEKLKYMLTAFNASLGIVDKYEGYLMLVATGELEPEKMIDLILGR